MGWGTEMLWHGPGQGQRDTNRRGAETKEGGRDRERRRKGRDTAGKEKAKGV